MTKRYRGWNDENVNFIVLEPWNEEINAKKTTAVKDAIYAVMTRKPEKKRLAGIRTLTYAILVQCVTKELANQLGAGPKYTRER